MFYEKVAVKCEARSTKFETNMNVPNAKFKTKDALPVCKTYSYLIQPYIPENMKSAERPMLNPEL